ncbi:MAG: lipocalin family protein [Ignavibacteriaceae bacterium]|nr:lipocalin family protein [Ignavibacteriaceae bacterium]
MNYILKNIAAIFILSFTIIKGQDMNNELRVVNSVDLKKYIGLWYEIAKIPNRFQKDCKRNTTAIYSFREDGKIKVVNSCMEDDGSIKIAEGVARVADTRTNAKLEVSFVKLLGINLFWGDYWIIGLGDNYEYALVGSPDRKYGWILSRTPKLQQEKLNRISELLKNKGYDISRFEFTLQD